MMRAQKIAIAVSKDEHGRYAVQVLGIDGDRVVSSVSELEETGLGFATCGRVVERLWITIKLRLNRGLLEFRTDRDYDTDDSNTMGRQ